MVEADTQLTLVLLPGMDGTATLFEPLIAALGDSFHIRRVAYPCDQALGYRELAEVARQALPVDGKFILLGESFSGPIAIALAAAQPDGLLGVVLCSTFARNPHPLFKPLRGLADILPVKLLPNAVLSYFLMGRFSTPQLRVALDGALAQVSAAAFRARLKAVLAVDVSAQLQRLQVPLLYLQARHDRVVPAGAARHIASTYPATRIAALDGPHFLLQIAPQAAAAAIQAYALELAEASIRSRQNLEA
ncbi:alpha/beta fold hydrolase [Pseudoduganella violacea]|uniref:Pimeloyl-ACP methyl ester carboxylesterase n=1 Tax=Pseudoduganella violacea TaxID=1715466 RepID=A0A7W5BCS8_9BURK|nr:alpha/beta fold hydrolase [Pseudoduganella violacea]MBB3120751.1 pimeloyl-ACP methyl ester carboxylesterase [Pseudoduganella violacea]